MLKGIDLAVTQRWSAALARAEAAAGATPQERTKAVGKAFRRELASLGAATGAAAAAPGLGTAGAVSMLVAEAGWFAYRATDLIMTVGAVHGHVDSSVEQRRAWVLSILAFGEQAANEFAALAGEVNESMLVGGERVGTLMAGVVSGDAATVDALRRVNTTLATKVVTKYGSRRGMITIGKLMPFGIGAAVGGTANWALSRAVSAQALKFFGDYHLLVVPPPPSIPPPPQGDRLPPPLDSLRDV